MRIYELIYILKPNLPEEDTDAIVEQFTKVIEDGGGKIDKTDRWGKRRLAYKIQHEDEGYYVLVQYSLEKDHDFSKEIERRLRVADSVIKFMTIRIDEDLARVEKLKKRRAVRAANKPAHSEGRSRPRSAPAAPGKPSAAATAPAATTPAVTAPATTAPAAAAPDTAAPDTAAPATAAPATAAPDTAAPAATTPAATAPAAAPPTTPTPTSE